MFYFFNWSKFHKSKCCFWELSHPPSSIDLNFFDDINKPFASYSTYEKKLHSKDILKTKKKKPNLCFETSFTSCLKYFHNSLLDGTFRKTIVKESYFENIPSKNEITEVIIKHKKAIWGKLRKPYENLGGYNFADNTNFKKNIFRNYFKKKKFGNEFKTSRQKLYYLKLKYALKISSMFEKIFFFKILLKVII